MSLLPIRSTSALSVRSNVIFAPRNPSYLDIRFGPCRARMESLEARRVLNAGGISDFNGIPLPDYESNWCYVVPLDESGSLLEATAEDGSVMQLDLIAFEDGSQVYDFSMASIDPQILYTTDDGSTNGWTETYMEQAEGTATLELADVSEAYPTLTLSIDENGVVSAGDVPGITSNFDGSIYLDDLMLPAHVVMQADGTLALAPDYAPAMIFYTMDGTDVGTEGDPDVDTGEMFENVRNVALADFNGWGVTEINVDDNGVVTAVADGESRTVTLVDGDRGNILIDGVDSGYELQQGRENGWTLVPFYQILTTDYFGEQSVTLADFNGWGVTEITITDGNLIATADGVARTVSVDEGGMISVDGVLTDYMFYTDGVNSGLTQIYTLEDDYTPGVDEGEPTVDGGEFEPTMTSNNGESAEGPIRARSDDLNEAEVAVFVALPNSRSVREPVALSFFASQSIVDSDDQSVI